MIKRKKLKCPHCGIVHSFQEVLFPVENDSGYWKVECSECQKLFALPIINPFESSFDNNYLIKERLEENRRPSGVVFAIEIIEYNFNLNKTSFEFDYSGPPIYRCCNTGEPLEMAANYSLTTSLSHIVDCHTNASNYYLANQCPDFEFFVVSLKIDCSCGNDHFATFYSPFSKTGEIPRTSENYLLSDISNVDMEGGLSGVFSKSEVMSSLEKLFIRWNLHAHQIIIAAPFVGHQYLKREEKLEVWNWLLSQLDPDKSIFITRAATFANFRDLLESEEGLSAPLLEAYNLQNRLVSANTKKNDFHAKFFAGLNEHQAEILSGSANIVKGPSMENCTFAELDVAMFKIKYWDKLNMNIPLNSPTKRHWVVASERSGNWACGPAEGLSISPPRSV